MSFDECATMATCWTKSIYAEDDDSEEEKVDLNTLLIDVKDPKIIKQIEVLNFVCSRNYTGNNSCQICLETFPHRRIIEIGILACKHVFHKACIVMWLRQPTSKMGCPLCKRHALSGKAIEEDTSQKKMNYYGKVSKNTYDAFTIFTCPKCW